MLRTWKQALFIVQPETLLRWHRELFRLFWKHTSKADSRQQKIYLVLVCGAKWLIEPVNSKLSLF
jgi:putative transposase